MTTTRTRRTRRNRIGADPDLPRIEKLAERMRHGFIDGQDAAFEFLSSQAWTKLKFGTCYTFWSARMSDVDCSIPVIKRAAFVMFDEDFTPRKVAGVIKGLAPLTAVSLKRQKDNGVTADEASMNANAAIPAKPTVEDRPKLVVFQVERSEYESEWAPKIRQLMEASGSKSVPDTLADFALSATRTALAKVKLSPKPEFG